MSDSPSLRINQSKFTRREFLKFTGVGLAGFLIPGKAFSSAQTAFHEGKAAPLLGRITYSGHELYKEPHSESKLIMRMAKDSVLRITGVTIGEEETSPNRIYMPIQEEFNLLRTKKIVSILLSLRVVALEKSLCPSLRHIQVWIQIVQFCIGSIMQQHSGS